MAVALEVLLDVETEIEGVFAAYLGTTLGLPTVTSDSDSTLETPRVEIVAILTSEGPHQFIIPGSGANAGLHLYDQKNIELRVDLVYSPNAPNPQNPGTLRGKLRKVFTDYGSIKAAFAVNGYLILASDTLQQTGGNRLADNPESDTETLSISLTAVIFVDQTQLAAST